MKLFKLLSLIPLMLLLGGAVQAQDFTSRYFHYDMHYDTAGTTWSLSDINGNNVITVPDQADADDVEIYLGKASTTAPTFTIRGLTADADDDGELCITPGGACGNYNRGGYLMIRGPERGTASTVLQSAVGGSVYISSRANVYFSATGVTKWTIPNDADPTESLVFGTASLASSAAIIRGARADGSDDGSLFLTPGGACAAGRGSCLKMWGKDNGSQDGDMHLWADDDIDMWPGNNFSWRFDGAHHLRGMDDGQFEPSGVTTANLPASCYAGALLRATDSDDCSAGGGNGALCICNNTGNGWILLLNY